MRHPPIEKSYEETQMQNTENESDARTSNIPEEPKSNTEQPMTCVFNRGHKNISLKKFRQHLRICKERPGEGETIDAGTRRRRKSEKRERDYQGEREKLPPWRSIHKLKTRGARSDGSMLLRLTTPATTSQTRA
jgi:hypothetical protein